MKFRRGSSVSNLTSSNLKKRRLALTGKLIIQTRSEQNLKAKKLLQTISNPSIKLLPIRQCRIQPNSRRIRYGKMVRVVKSESRIILLPLVAPLKKKPSTDSVIYVGTTYLPSFARATIDLTKNSNDNLNGTLESTNEINDNDYNELSIPELPPETSIIYQRTKRRAKSEIPERLLNFGVIPVIRRYSDPSMIKKDSCLKQDAFLEDKSSTSEESLEEHCVPAFSLKNPYKLRLSSGDHNFTANRGNYK